MYTPWFCLSNLLNVLSRLPALYSLVHQSLSVSGLLTEGTRRPVASRIKIREHSGQTYRTVDKGSLMRLRNSIWGTRSVRTHRLSKNVNLLGTDSPSYTTPTDVYFTETIEIYEKYNRNFGRVASFVLQRSWVVFVGVCYSP